MVDLLVDQRGPKSPFDMPEAEKLAKYNAVKPKIEEFVDRKNKLVSEGMSPEQAEFQVYDKAPENSSRSCRSTTPSTS